jgi:hypothetical protein
LVKLCDTPALVGIVTLKLPLLSMEFVATDVH